MFFINLFLLFGIGTWLPKLMMNQGYNLVSGLSLLLTLNLGSFLFVPIGGKLADKFGHKPILVIYFLVASVLLYTLSFKWDIAVLSILVFIKGGMINGSLLYAYVGVNYPLNFRSTALGGIVGFGRLGGAFGPTIMGILLTVHAAYCKFSSIPYTGPCGGTGCHFDKEYGQFIKQFHYENCLYKEKRIIINLMGSLQGDYS